MKNATKYILAAGLLLLIGAGCEKAAAPAAGGPSDNKPAAEQPKPVEDKTSIDNTVDGILKDATAETDASNNSAEDVQAVNADNTEINSLKDSSYEVQ